MAFPPLGTTTKEAKVRLTISGLASRLNGDPVGSWDFMEPRHPFAPPYLDRQGPGADLRGLVPALRARAIGWVARTGNNASPVETVL